MSINKVKNISSKKGDGGTSKNFNNESFRKSDILFETLGTIDELSSYLGLTYHYTKYEEITNIQKNLQKLMTIIATSPNSELYPKIEKFSKEDIIKIENLMQDELDEKPLEPKLYLPGSEKTKTGAYFDICRTLTRRVERRIDEFIIDRKRLDLEDVRSYINRLSDYLFVLSCNK